MDARVAIARHLQRPGARGRGNGAVRRLRPRSYRASPRNGDQSRDRRNPCRRGSSDPARGGCPCGRRHHRRSTCGSRWRAFAATLLFGIVPADPMVLGAATIVMLASSWPRRSCRRGELQRRIPTRSFAPNRYPPTAKVDNTTMIRVIAAPFQTRATGSHKSLSKEKTVESCSTRPQLIHSVFPRSEPGIPETT